MAATSDLLWASTLAGWRAVDLAPVLHLSRSTVSKRIERAKQRRGGVPPTGLDVEPYRPSRPRTATEVAEGSRTEGNWLTIGEAAGHAAVSAHTIRSWQRTGVLPNSLRLNRTRLLYLRADLDRMLAAPRYNGTGPSKAAVLEQIAANGGV